MLLVFCGPGSQAAGNKLETLASWGLCWLIWRPFPHFTRVSSQNPPSLGLDAPFLQGDLTGFGQCEELSLHWRICGHLQDSEMMGNAPAVRVVHQMLPDWIFI
jgi:hypothetical protein